MERLEVSIRTSPGRCVYCKDDVNVDERAACANCLAVHHQECWETHTCCAACGQSEVLVRPGEAVDEAAQRQARPMVEVQPLLGQKKQKKPRRRPEMPRWMVMILLFIIAVTAAIALTVFSGG